MPDSPFTRAEAHAAGISDAMLGGRRFRRLFHGVYVCADQHVDAVMLARAALRTVGAGACVGGPFAAAVLGLPAERRGREVELVLPDASRRPRRADIRVRVAPHARQVSWRGVPVLHPVDLFVDLARTSTLVELVVLGDALVRSRHATPEDLRAAAAACRAQHGRLAARAAAYVRAGVDSPMESRLRMLLVLAGLPEPTVNHVVRRSDGSVRYRIDLSWPELRVAVEYDGRHHRADLDQWDADVVRRDWFEAAGWCRLDVVARGVYQRPAETVDRVAAVLRSRGWAGRVDPTWLLHF